MFVDIESNKLLFASELEIAISAVL